MGLECAGQEGVLAGGVVGANPADAGAQLVVHEPIGAASGLWVASNKQQWQGEREGVGMAVGA